MEGSLPVINMPAEKQMPMNEKSTWVRKTPSDVAKTERSDMTDTPCLPFKAWRVAEKKYDSLTWNGFLRLYATFV